MIRLYYKNSCICLNFLLNASKRSFHEISKYIRNAWRLPFQVLAIILNECTVMRFIQIENCV